MVDPVSHSATVIVFVVIFAIGVAIFHFGGLWPLLFFITATAVESDHDSATPE